MRFTASLLSIGATELWATGDNNAAAEFVDHTDRHSRRKYQKTLRFMVRFDWPHQRLNPLRLNIAALLESG
jgi:hypothetical protein